MVFTQSQSQCLGGWGRAEGPQSKEALSQGPGRAGGP